MRHRSDWYSDTDPKALAVFLALQRAMSPAEKVALTLQMSEMVMRFAEAAIRDQFPQADNREVFLRMAARHLDRETMLRVYGWDPSRSRTA